MARDLGEDIHKIFELPIRVFQTFYGISSCCRAIRQIVLAPCVAKAERGQSMKKNVNLSNVATVNPSTLNYPHPYFVPIDDGDEETIKFYKRNDVPVAHIALPGRMKHYYAVFNADTQEYADLMNRTYNNWEKRAARAKASQEEYESSYDVMVENGYDAKDDTNNPEEIIAYKTVINALTNALDELTDEKLRA